MDSESEDGSEEESEEESGEEEEEEEEILAEALSASNEVTSDDPMNYNDVLPGMWVVVEYEGEKFLGNVQHKKNGEFNVLCLDKPFGIREPQSYESVVPIYYDKVFQTDIVPTPTQIGSSGRKQRKWLFTY